MLRQGSLSEDQHVNSCSAPVLSLRVIHLTVPIKFELHIEIRHINALSRE